MNTHNWLNEWVNMSITFTRFQPTTYMRFHSIFLYGLACAIYKYNKIHALILYLWVEYVLNVNLYIWYFLGSFFFLFFSIFNILRDRALHANAISFSIAVRAIIVVVCSVYINFIKQTYSNANMHTRKKPWFKIHSTHMHMKWSTYAPCYFYRRCMPFISHSDVALIKCLISILFYFIFCIFVISISYVLLCG